MTIENARALQEQLANEAIIRQRKNESKELADDCIRSIAVVGKATKRHAGKHAHSRSKRGTLATLGRERTQQIQAYCALPLARS